MGGRRVAGMRNERPSILVRPFPWLSQLPTPSLACHFYLDTVSRTRHRFSFPHRFTRSLSHTRTHTLTGLFGHQEYPQLSSKLMCSGTVLLWLRQ